MTEQELHNQAITLFDLFGTEELGLEKFQFELIKLAVQAGQEGIWPIEGSIIVLSMCIEQFSDYKKDPVRYGYLLSRFSSGSFLNTFEPYCD